MAHAGLLKCAGVAPTVINHNMKSTFNLSLQTKIHATEFWEEDG